MSECNAVRAGFSTAFRRPSLFVAELAWRWAFDLAAWLLIAYAVLLFLRSVPVSNADMFGLSGIIPGRVGSTILHIFAGSGPKMLRLAVVLLAGLTLLSWIASSIGRSAVLRALLGESGSPLSLFALNLFRTLGRLLVTLAYAGCVYLIARAGDTQAARPLDTSTDFSLAFAALAFLISWIWGKLNGRLTLANIFLVRSGGGIGDAIVSATDITVRRLRQFAWIGIVFGAIKLMLWIATLFGMLMAFSAFAPFSTALACCAMFGVLMIYSVLANFFTLGSLAAQVRVIEWDELNS